MNDGTSYERLARLFIEDQRSVLGDRAAQIANGVEGVEVQDDGSVVLQGPGRVAVGRLTEEFTDVFGGSVTQSMQTAARQLDHPVAVPSALEQG